MTNLTRAITISMLIAVAVIAPAKAEFALKDNDRVVIFGDSSIGTLGFAMELDRFVRIKYPDLKAEIYTMALPRTDAERGNERLERQVLAYKPTMAILCFGLEDGQRRDFEQATLDNYLKQMEKMVNTLKGAGIKVVVVTPPPPDHSKMKSLARVNYKETVAKFAEATVKFAQEKNLPLIDWHKGCEEYFTKSKFRDKRGLTKDGLVQTGVTVSVFTDLLLTYWNAEPINFAITADWNSDTASATEGTATVESRTNKEMVLSLKDIPIPFVFSARRTTPPDQWPMTKWCKYRLKIDNMPAQPRGVLISEADGKNAKPFLTDQLTQGADLSTIGPLADNSATQDHISKIRIKENQAWRYRDTCIREVPEPEFTEAYKMYLEADLKLAMATHKVLLRTPVTMTTKIKIAMVDNKAPEGKAGSRTKAAPAPHPGPKPGIKPGPKPDNKPKRGNPKDRNR